MKKADLAAENATLRQKLVAMEAQLDCAYVPAYTALGRAGQDRFMASGLILTLTTLGGKQLVEPVVIKDGLSEASIAALQEDLRQSQIKSRIMTIGGGDDG